MPKYDLPVTIEWSVTIALGRHRPPLRSRLFRRKRIRRKWLVQNGAALARALPRGLILGVSPLLARALELRVGSQLRRSMTAALGQAPAAEVVRRYCRDLADFHTRAALVNRADLRRAGLEGLQRLDAGALSIVRQALALGKGAVLTFPHLIGYEFGLGLLSEQVPMSVLARTSPDPSYQEVKADWYAALGLQIAWRARRGAGSQSLGEVTRFLRVLKENRVLAITPDLLSGPGTGIRVRLFGREAELPAGPFFLAIRTGAPLIPAFLSYSRRRCRVVIREPLPIPPGDRDAAIAALAQDWTGTFEEWVSDHPASWQFWLDKRWSRWLAEPPANQA